jgi:hypothetical protein
MRGSPAHALAARLMLVTNNTKRFARISGLHTELDLTARVHLPKAN